MVWASEAVARPVGASVGVGTSEVKGTSLAELAPGKAGSVSSGELSMLSGFRTLNVLVSTSACGVKQGGNEPVDDVHNTVSNEDVGDEDTSFVDVDAAIGDGDVNVVSADSLDGGVAQSAAVGDSASNNVVPKDAAENLGGQVACERGNLLESGVVRGEDGDVFEAEESLAQIGGLNGSDKGGQLGSDGSVDDVLGDVEDVVDDVDDTTSKVEVLQGISTKSPERRSPITGGTYSLLNSGPHAQSAGEVDTVILSHGLDDLAAGDGAVVVVGQQGGHEDSLLRDIASVVGAVEDVVGEESGDVVGVEVRDLHVTEELGDGVVAGGKQGDVGKATEGLNEVGLGSQQGCRWVR